MSGWVGHELLLTFSSGCHYTVLGLRRDASPADVKAAFYAASRRFHPDGPEADPVRFLAAKRAYDVLRDPERRRAFHEAGQGIRSLSEQDKEQVGAEDGAN